MEQHILDDVVTLRSESVAFEKKKELCQPSPKDKKPPPLSFTLKKAGDVPKTTETWIDDNLPIDILLLTSVESRDFLSCFTFLDQPFKCYKKEIGVVYFGGMGDVSNQEKLKVALMNCSEGAAVPGGSLTVVLNAVKVLQPKAVFLVGTCISLGLEKARMGDVVVSSRLTTAEGFKTPGSPLLGNLVRDAPYGWDAPLKNPEEWEVKVHCNGDILSQSLRERCQNGTICEEYPTAVAIETEGEGVYAAAYDTNIEWVIVKGVASYFHQSHSTTSEWISFASTMAASVVAKMLSDPTVFREWLNYNQDTPTAPAPAPAPMRDQQDSLREYGESFVRLLIRSKHLEKEKREVIEEILTKEVEDYLKFHDHSGDNHGRAMKSFTKHLINVYCVHLVTVGAGSVFIVLDCPTLDSLELLWSDYLAGHLDEVAERCLITDETKKKLNLETICLKTTIEKENYLNCRKALVELRSLDSEDFLSDESEKFWVNIPGDYEQKKLTHFVQAAKDLCPTEMQQGIMEKFLCRIWQIDYGQLARNDSYVTLNGFLELVALFGPFKPGPDGCLQKMYDLMTNSVSKRQGKKESWFAGIMDETEAANLLCDQSPGHFLIRISSSRPHEGVFVLAVKTSDNGVVQIQIERDLKDNTLLLADKKFPDLMSIVEALRHDLLFENCSQLLTNPCPGLPLNALFTGYEVVTGRRGACGRGRQLSVSVETGVSAAALVLQECDEAGESFLSDESQKFWVNIVGDNEQKKWPEFVQAAKNCCPTEMQKGNIEDFLCRILKIDYGQLPRNERHVTRNGFLELVALFGPFKPGPHGCLQKMYELMKQSISRGGGGNKESWFAGNMDETEAANLLGDQSPGHFLIRISSSRAWEGVFVLAVKTRVNGVVQIQIERDLQHNTLLLAGKTFPDLMSIVSVLRRDALLENCKQLLINPCPGLPLNALFTGYESATGRRRGRGRGTRLR